MNKLSSPLAPISWGELVDKITILEIKRLKILSSKSLINVNKELVLLNNIFLENEIYLNGVFELKDQLFEVNVKLWEIEDKIRIMESKNIFDDKFIQLARSIYTLNDERADLKRLINTNCNSEIVEEKSYSKYQ
jgi:hypothetical protein